MKLARSFADVVGYNWDSGRLDLSVHPFSSGTGNDSRITTRVDADDPLDCLYSTLHELGHALYEQGLPQDVALEPICSYVSMGVHESQSRLWENKIGRSKAFCTWLWPKINEAFGAGTVMSADELYRIINRVETGFIRTESDEVHYNLHVLLRFELERDLISGSLEVADLEIEWNRRFKRDFGISVPDAAHGVLQDVHWSAGMFGYFPTYSLGNIYAAQLNDTLRKAAPDLDEEIAAGKTETALHWLRENIHQKGSLVEPNMLIEQVVGQKISAEPLLNYLEDKYSELFAL
jgi:carboxypeptidase Taq